MTWRWNGRVWSEKAGSRLRQDDAVSVKSLKYMFTDLSSSDMKFVLYFALVVFLTQEKSQVAQLNSHISC